MLSALRSLVIIIISQSLIFASMTHAAQLALPTGDLIAPQIDHQPAKDSIKAGSSQQIKAIITDNVGIQTVTLFYRTLGAKEYKRVQMNKVEATDEYVATLGINDTVEPGVEYYIQATDLAGNALLFGYSFSPVAIAIIPNDPAPSVAQTPTEISTSEPPAKEEQIGKKKTNKWLWIGLGVLAVGAIAAVASGGGDEGGNTIGPPTKKGTVNLTAPVPGN